jgi:FKBP-type peptidyl-prolyl cis-trans isomerase FklB
MAMNTKALTFTILAVVGAACTLPAQESGQFKSELEKASYAAGLWYANDWKRQELEFDMDQLMQGIKDAQAGKGKLTEKEMQETLQNYSKQANAKRMEKRNQLGEKNKKDGEAFLAENKNKPGVFTLTNGLQYKVIKDGSGEVAKPTDVVTVEYRGTFIDGSEFDSSAKAGKPFTTRVAGGVIQGWTEALMRMKAGSKWQLFIPPSLAYGDRGTGPIPPNTTLLFDVELVSIQPPPPAPPPAPPLTSDIIKVPSLEEMKKGAKIETIKAEDVERLQKEQQSQQKTNK